MATLTAGRFSYDTESGILSGPAQYMQEQGDALLAQITTGEDTVFNMSAHYSPSAEMAVLVRLQTDFAGWAGMQQMLAWCKPATPAPTSAPTAAAPRAMAESRPAAASVSQRVAPADGTPRRHMTPYRLAMLQKIAAAGEQPRAGIEPARRLTAERLVEMGLVARTESVVGGIFYRITDAGREALA